MKHNFKLDLNLYWISRSVVKDKVWNRHWPLFMNVVHTASQILSTESCCFFHLSWPYLFCTGKQEQVKLNTSYYDIKTNKNSTKTERNPSRVDIMISENHQNDTLLTKALTQNQLKQNANLWQGVKIRTKKPVPVDMMVSEGGNEREREREREKHFFPRIVV